jgi:hypothetical protein
MAEIGMKELLDKMHRMLGQSLVAKLDAGEMTASELNVARQFLKDNGIQAVITPDNPLGHLTARLPSFKANDMN